MAIITDKKEIIALREGGKILASVIKETASIVKPGLKTSELDSFAEKLIRRYGGRPSFKGYKTSDDEIPFPASLCVSINDEVVHGLPSDRILKEGDIVSLDSGMEYKNFYTDMAITVPVGKISIEAKKIIATAENALLSGIVAIKNGGRIGDIGEAIQSYVEKEKFGVIRTLVGHGLGRKAHEPPEIPNFGKSGRGPILKTGMVLAIEPMISAGDYDIYLDKDMWTWKTKDGSLSAHFEHTIIVTEAGAEIITKI